MTQKELYNALSDEQKQLHEHLEENEYRIYFFAGDGKICAEIENWTDGGVDMVINLMPFGIIALQDYYNNFDMDEEIDLHRQDERYRKAFRIKQSVMDFETWVKSLGDVICQFCRKTA